MMLMLLYKKNKARVSQGQALWIIVQKHNLKLDHILWFKNVLVLPSMSSGCSATALSFICG